MDHMRFAMLTTNRFQQHHDAGTGKTAIMRNTLAAMDAEQVVSSTINLNSFSDAPALQPILEGPLEKKSGAYYWLCDTVSAPGTPLCSLSRRALWRRNLVRVMLLS